MHIEDCSSAAGRRGFLEFHATLYRDDPGYVDSSTILLRLFLKRGDRFTRRARTRPVAVVEGGATLAQGILLQDPARPLLQLAHFDALPGRPDAAARLWDEARAEARCRGLPRVVAGLHGHVSYGVGLLTQSNQRPATFDTLHTHPYYAAYFDALGLERHDLTTYSFNPQDLAGRFTEENRPDRRHQYRTMRPGQWRGEMERFGDLCNRCLADTFLFAPRPLEEWVELMAPLRWLLRPEHLVFALEGGREVGFLLWHPDYNETLRPGRRHSLPGLFLRLLLLQRRIRTVKANAIGLMPGHRGTGAALGLLLHALRLGGRSYQRGETNFVWDLNAASRRFNLALGNRPDRRYAVWLGDA